MSKEVKDDGNNGEKVSDEYIETILRGFATKRGIDVDHLDDLSDKDFKDFCVDVQIDGYFMGKMDRKVKDGD